MGFSLVRMEHPYTADRNCKQEQDWWPGLSLKISNFSCIHMTAKNPYPTIEYE